MGPKTIREFIKTNSLQLTIQAVGVVVLILNLWLATKLAPLAKDIAVLVTRVEANEKVDARQDQTIGDVTTIKQEVSDIKTDIGGIKTDITGIRGSVDEINRYLRK